MWRQRNISFQSKNVILPSPTWPQPYSFAHDTPFQLLPRATLTLLTKLPADGTTEAALEADLIKFLPDKGDKGGGFLSRCSHLGPLT